MRPKLGYFAVLLSLDHTISVKLHTMIAGDNVSHLVELKLSKKNLGPKSGPNRPKSGLNLGFSLFLKLCSLVFD